MPRLREALAVAHSSARAMGGPTKASKASVQPGPYSLQLMALGVTVPVGVALGVRVAVAVAVSVGGEVGRLEGLAWEEILGVAVAAEEAEGEGEDVGGGEGENWGVSVPVERAEALGDCWGVKEKVGRAVVVAGPPRSVCQEGVGIRETLDVGGAEGVRVRDWVADGEGEAVPPR